MPPEHVDCKFFENGTCKLASMYSDDKVQIYEKQQCQSCMSHPKHGDMHEIVAGAVFYHWHMRKRAGTKEQHDALMPHVKQMEIPKDGPGTELKALISWFAVTDPKCGCQQKADLMNIWGPTQCKENMEKILGWLEEEAKTANMLFYKPAAKVLVLAAIKLAEVKARKKECLNA